MKKRHPHIRKILAAFLLSVFFVALLPWSMLHHHAETISLNKEEKYCTHKEHFQVHVEKCLICAVHFEKHYTASNSFVAIYLSSQPVSLSYKPVARLFTEWTPTSLRGPPFQI